MICCQLLKLLTTTTSFLQIHKEKKMEGKGGKEGRWKGENREGGNPNRRMKCSHLPIWPPLFVKRKRAEFLRVSTLAFSSNLPQHCFTWFLLSHQGTSLNPSLQIRGFEGISGWAIEIQKRLLIFILEIQQKPLYFLCLSEALSTMQVNHIRMKYLTFKKWKA